MSILRKPVSLLIRSALAGLSLYAAQAFGSTCCLSTMLDVEASKAQLTQAGYSNVQTVANTCSHVAYSGTLMGMITVTYDWLLISATDVLTSVITVTAGGPPMTVSDTSFNFCRIAAERGTPEKAPALSSFPNPFHGSVSVEFANPAGRADIQIFNVGGARVADLQDVSSTRFEWTPRNLPQGLYCIRIFSAGKTFSRMVYYLK